MSQSGQERPHTGARPAASEVRLADARQSLTPDAQPPLTVPDHELLRRIGAGSYGEVWLARNTVGTLRAVKIVHRKTFWSDHPFEREFKGIQKFEPISRSHEGLVDILHIGRGERYFYYVMELADGAEDGAVSSSERAELTATRNPEPETQNSYVPRTLAADLGCRRRLPVAECLRIGLMLTDALAHLHRHGLVHRDIKPANIIFVSGVAKLADIGLVAEVSEARSYVGTEGFIPPEGPGTAQADLYSLGKLLYEISTGQDRHAFPALPPDLAEQSEVEQLVELNAVLLKACQPDPGQRYPTAEAMHADLELLRAGKSVKQQHKAALRWTLVKKAVIVVAVATLGAAGLFSIRRSLPQPLDPLTTGKNVGGYPPSAMRGTTNKAAWDHYRLGYAAQARWDTKQATAHYNAAVALDPKFALAYAMLWWIKAGDTWQLTHGGSDEFRSSAVKLVKLDNGLAETHSVLGFIRFWEWSWSEAEAEYRLALRLNPDCIPAVIVLGFYLSHMGRCDEAVAVLDRGLQIDPTRPNLPKMKGHVYFVRRQFPQALELYRESIRREPLFSDSHLRAARSYLAMTNYPAAIEEFERHDLLVTSPSPAETKQEYAELRRAFDAGGARGYWLKRLELTQKLRKSEEHPYEYAQIYARLGEKDQALTFLEKAYERHDELVYLIYDEFWDQWRDEPRFEVIRKKIGMPRHPNFPAE